MTLLPSFEAASLIFTSEIISISPTAFALLPLLSVTACDAADVVGVAARGTAQLL